MSGYQTFKRWQRIEEYAGKLGFRIGNPKHGWGGTDSGDMVAIFPKEEELPTFTRDAEIFSGSFRELEVFLLGWERAQQYDMLLRLTDDKKRKIYADKERERQRIAQERIEKKKMFAILANKDEQEVEGLIK
jgi:hypothetical protein